MNRFVLGCAAGVAVASSGFVFALTREEPKLTPRVQPGERVCSRVVYFRQEPFGIPAQLFLSYGSAKWSDEIARMAEQVPAEKRVRLGKDYWPLLDVNVPVKMGDETFEPGLYYLAAQKTAEGWSLLVLDAEDVRGQHVDAFMIDQIDDGTAIPLRTSTDSGNVAEMLKLAFRTEGSDVHLDIHFGPHHGTVQVHPDLDDA